MITSLVYFSEIFFTEIAHFLMLDQYTLVVICNELLWFYDGQLC